MKHLHYILSIAFLLAGCALPSPDKTPQTRTGQLNSCMLQEVYRLHDAGAMSAPDFDENRLAWNVLAICRSRLDIDSSEFNAVQSLEIISSTIRTLRQ